MAGYYDRDRNTRTIYGHNANARNAAGQMNHPTTHVGNTSEYMASGYPFAQTITVSGNFTNEGGTTTGIADGDIFKVTFPFVTRWVLVRATNTNGSTNVAINKLFMGFSEVGVKTNDCFFDVSFLDGTRLELKCSELFFKVAAIADVTNVQIIAGLTNIPAEDFVVTTSAVTNIGVESNPSIILVHDASA